MKLTIHRGAKEIGGSCVELVTGNTRILLDLGRPLKGIAPELEQDLKSVDAVVVSHPHEDHFGLIEKLPPEVPVYIGRAGLELIRASRLFTGKEPLTNNFRHFEKWKDFQIGDFKLYPYLMDHSAVDSYAFTIEADNKRIFYTGDFRGHGRKRKVFDEMLRNPPKNIDLMLMEGTMLGRGGKGCADEEEVETVIASRLKAEPGLCFLICSSQNIDRLVSAYNACLRSGRALVLDIYTAWVLRLVKEMIGGRVMDITRGSYKLRVLSKGSTASKHYGVIDSNRDIFGSFAREIYREGTVIQESDLAKDPGHYLVKTSFTNKLLDRLKPASASAIYSMWEGYQEEEHNPRHYRDYERLKGMLGGRFVEIHTSGHAVLEDLKKLSVAISPAILVPIHTEYADEFEKYFENVKRLKDKECIVL